MISCLEKLSRIISLLAGLAGFLQQQSLEFDWQLFSPALRELMKNKPVNMITRDAAKIRIVFLILVGFEALTKLGREKLQNY